AEVAMTLDLVTLLLVGAEVTVALDLVTLLLVGPVVAAKFVRHCSSFGKSVAPRLGAVISLDAPGETNLPTSSSNSQPRLRSCLRGQRRGIVAGIRQGLCEPSRAQRPDRWRRFDPRYLGVRGGTSGLRVPRRRRARSRPVVLRPLRARCPRQPLDRDPRRP